MDIHAEKLNLDELYREKKMRQDNKLKIYNRILKEFTTKLNMLVVKETLYVFVLMSFLNSYLVSQNMIHPLVSLMLLKNLLTMD